MEDQYETGVEASVSVVSAALSEFEKNHSTARLLVKAKVREVLSGVMNGDIADIITNYAILITKADASSILYSRVNLSPSRWIRNLMIVAVALNDLELFTSISQTTYTFVERNEVESVEGFHSFRNMPIFLPPRNRFLQLVTNLICFTGKGGDKSVWFTKFFRDETHMSTGTLYMAAGVGPVEAIKINLKKCCYRIEYGSLLKAANDGKKDEEVVDFLTKELAKLHT